MANYEWPANDYAIGSYIQATVANQYIDSIRPEATDSILDIGCGDGSYTKNILAKIPQGKCLGIDRSANMLKLAHEKIRDYPNFSVQQCDVLEMKFNEQFDYIVSFWCLQWCPEPKKAFSNMYHALKKGGKVFALLPTGDDPLITSYERLKASGDFSCLEDFVPPVNYPKVRQITTILPKLPFSKINVETISQSIVLPSLDTFRKFVNGIAFYNDKVPDEEIPRINEAMVQAFDRDCQQKYGGEYRFDFSVFIVRGEK
jgi:ubiquinone/menaquinone biosynthesis C-methylase UbiE